MCSGNTKGGPARFRAADCLVIPPLWDKRILGLVAENLAQEQFRPLVLRIVKELIWLVSLNNFTFVHKDHAVGDCFCKAHFVGYA